MPARGFFRTCFAASRKKSDRVSLHSMSTEPAPEIQPITSGFSSAGVANSYNTTEHFRLSHCTPIATNVECCMSVQNCHTLLAQTVCTFAGRVADRITRNPDSFRRQIKFAFCHSERGEKSLLPCLE